MLKLSKAKYQKCKFMHHLLRELIKEQVHRTYIKHLVNVAVHNKLQITVSYKKDAVSAIPQWQVGMSKGPNNVRNEKCD